MTDKNQLNHIMRNGIEVIRHMLSQADHRLVGMEKDLAELSQRKEANIEMQIEQIILHHSLTTDSRTVSWQAIRRYHIQELHWRDVGYHFGIELVNDDYEILTGRMLNEEGAHCKQYQMNKKSIGVCLIGNFDKAEPPEDQWSLTLKLVRSLCEVFCLPITCVHGHREYASYKSCPGKEFNLDKFRREL